MASGFYANYDNECLGNGNVSFVDLDADTIMVGIINGTTDYTENLTTHEDWADVAAYGTDTSYNSEPNQTLGSKDVGTTTDGVFDAADATFTSVAIDGTKDVDALIVYKSTGTPATSPLICFLDGFTAVTPNGGDIVIVWNGSGIFKR